MNVCDPRQEHPDDEREPPASARRYDGSGRARRARETRAKIVTAAAECFARAGYAATSIRVIADTAGTSPETVYAAFGSKAALLRAWIDRAAVGDDEEIPLLERRESLDAMTAGSIAERRAAQVALIRRINERMAVPMRVLAAAAYGDADLTELVADYERRRRSDIEVFVRALDDGPCPAPPPPDVVDLLAVWTSAEMYARLVIDRGWTAEAYERSIEAISATLLA